VKHLSSEVGNLEFVGVVPKQVVTAADTNLCEDGRHEILVELHALNFVQEVDRRPDATGHTRWCQLTKLRMLQVRLPAVPFIASA
jgi:hypothetical protein